MAERSLTAGKRAREQFPIFDADGTAHLAYLDSAASTQKPQVVIDRLRQYLSYEHANIHRGAYSLSGVATTNYEKAREQLAAWIGAKDSSSIIFTKGATESINLVSYGAEVLFKHGDTILLSVLEHHSNIVPWQMLAKRKNLHIEYVDILDDGQLDLDDLEQKVNQYKPKLLSISHTSNAIGTTVPVTQVLAAAKSVGALVMIDATQAVAHTKIDVEALDVDFLAFSGHKMYGPTGIGVLYAKPELLEQMNPFLGGGDMIREVALEGSTWADAPQKFEAGTPPIAEAIALGTAIEFLQEFDLAAVASHEQDLLQYALENLRCTEGITIFGPAASHKPQASIVSFNVQGIHAHDLATVADTHNVQIRAGHHCAMPLLKRLGVPATARLSIGIYTIKEDIDQLMSAITAAKKLFRIS